MATPHPYHLLDAERCALKRDAALGLISTHELGQRLHAVRQQMIAVVRRHPRRKWSEAHFRNMRQARWQAHLIYGYPYFRRRWSWWANPRR